MIGLDPANGNHHPFAGVDIVIDPTLPKGTAYVVDSPVPFRTPLADERLVAKVMRDAATHVAPLGKLFDDVGSAAKSWMQTWAEIQAARPAALVTGRMPAGYSRAAWRRTLRVNSALRRRQRKHPAPVAVRRRLDLPVVPQGPRAILVRDDAILRELAAYVPPQH